MPDKNCIRSEALVKKDLRGWWNKLPNVKMISYCQPCSAGVSDYVGWWKKTNMYLGQEEAIFLAVEAKKTMREGIKPMVPTDKQEAFLQQVKENGGLSFCVRSLAECKELFERAGIINKK